MSRIKLGRDSFARHDVRKEYTSGKECSWCGNTDKRMFMIVIDRDSIRPDKTSLDGEFCSMACVKSYHY